MSKVKLVMAEYEGDGAGLLELVRAFAPGAQIAVSHEPVAVSHVEPRKIAAPVPATARAPWGSLKRAGKGKRAKAAPPAPHAAAASGAPVPAAGEGTAHPLGAKLRGLLVKGAATSGELVKQCMGEGSANVYYQLSAMRQRGIIETRIDPQDGQRKNYLIAS